MGIFCDLTGQTFGRLTVIKRDGYIGKAIAWLCRCTCGNTVRVSGIHLKDGHTQSCGCLRKEVAYKSRFQDLAGQTFGKWTVLYLSGHGSNNHSRWHCICACGNEGDVDGSSLISGASTSCGCYQKEKARESLLDDLTGQRFGMFLVLGQASDKHKKRTYWRCRCDCGRELDVAAASLVHGKSKSCGCVMSYGEILLSKLLTKYHIRYEQQKTFAGCKYKKRLRFDFWLPDFGVCIEYNGRHHYEVLRYDHDSDNNYNIRTQRDNIKKEWCANNGIILIEIPYWDQDNIESILKEWLFLDDE